MSRKLNLASAVAVAATILATLVSADGSGAVAQSLAPAAITQQPINPTLSQPMIPPQTTVAGDVTGAEFDADVAPKAATLAELVANQPQPDDLSRELNCLAGAIYFESKSESLEGQLAVGRVIVARSKSGRFPSSYCGVVFQRSQFSFVRGNAMPGIAKSSRGWKNAVAIAQIAHEGSWKSQVEGALYFHAARISPSWRMTRLARVDNHVFYR
jgi:spore germination cell wall hydrolase CwlJ-like protein